MHPCIESHGILLTKNIEDNHMDYYMGEQMVLWFSDFPAGSIKNGKIS